MSEVPDHLIEKAAEAIHGPSWERRRSFYEAQDLPDLIMDERRRQARRALDAVADELRAEGARAEREEIAAKLEEMAEHAHGKEAHHTGADFAYAAHVVRSREGVRDGVA